MVKATSNNLGPVIEVADWFCLSLLLLAVIIRLALKRFVVRRKDIDNYVDDYLIATSSVFAVAQSVVLKTSVASGLGQRAEFTPFLQQQEAFKTLYAAHLLLVVSLCLSRLSMVAYIRSMSPFTVDQACANVLATIVLIWAVSCFFLVAFQCQVPTPWNLSHEKCINLVIVEGYINIFGMVVDVALMVVPIAIVFKLKRKSLLKKIGLAGPFTARISVIAVLVVQVKYGIDALRSDDILFNSWIPVVCWQAAQFLSILTASTIQLRPWLEVMESGFISNGDLARKRQDALGYSPKNLSEVSMLGSKVVARVRSWAHQFVYRGLSRADMESSIHGTETDGITVRNESVPINVCPEAGEAAADGHVGGQGNIQTARWTIEEAGRANMGSQETAHHSEK